MPKYDPEDDIPDLSGKVIVVTGDTYNLHQNKVTSRTAGLDILICNAGVMALPPGLTKDGYEIQFGTNHIGHALLIKLLLPTILATAKLPRADVRLVSLTSEGNQGHPLGGIVLKDLKTVQNFRILGPWQRYGQSKLANILYAAELARRYPDSGILFTSVHPGVLNTGLVQSLGWVNKALVWAGRLGQVGDEKREGRGAWYTCWAATARREGTRNGEFYFPVGLVGRKFRENTSERWAAELWEWTQKELEDWS